jgi:3-hydroxyacyl-[acyl-carrier-protein] dehydratase
MTPLMTFTFLDDILEQTADRIVAVKRVDPAEDYLADHFPTFPIMPGVLMVETMVQAARRMLASRGDSRLVLGQVKALKFGNFVRPNEALEVEVILDKDLGDGAYACRGTGVVRRSNAQNNAGETAVSGRFTMRPIRTEMVVENDSSD